MLEFFILSLLLSSSFAINFLKIPAIDSRLVDHINSVQSSWVAHENPRFTKITLAEAKSMMGTYLNDSNKLPVRLQLESAGQLKIRQKKKKVAFFCISFNYRNAVN